MEDLAIIANFSQLRRKRSGKFSLKRIRLIIKKRRFRFPKCKSVLTESIDGIKTGHIISEKYQNKLIYDYKNFNTTRFLQVSLNALIHWLLKSLMKDSNSKYENKENS
jgi:hypothetical protein